MHKIRQGEGYFNFQEMCPHCGTYHPIVIDDKDFKHYSIECPNCHNRMMLCTLCYWDQELEGDFDGCHKCDWKEDKGCFRSRSEEDDSDEEEDE